MSDFLVVVLAWRRAVVAPASIALFLPTLGSFSTSSGALPGPRRIETSSAMSALSASSSCRTFVLPPLLAISLASLRSSALTNCSNSLITTSILSGATSSISELSQLPKD